MTEIYIFFLLSSSSFFFVILSVSTGVRVCVYYFPSFTLFSFMQFVVYRLCFDLCLLCVWLWASTQIRILSIERIYCVWTVKHLIFIAEHTVVFVEGDTWISTAQTVNMHWIDFLWTLNIERWYDFDTPVNLMSKTRKWNKNARWPTQYTMSQIDLFLRTEQFCQ